MKNSLVFAAILVLLVMVSCLSKDQRATLTVTYSNGDIDTITVSPFDSEQWVISNYNGLTYRENGAPMFIRGSAIRTHTITNER